MLNSLKALSAFRSVACLSIVKCEKCVLCLRKLNTLFISQLLRNKADAICVFVRKHIEDRVFIISTWVFLRRDEGLVASRQCWVQVRVFLSFYFEEKNTEIM